MTTPASFHELTKDLTKSFELCVMEVYNNKELMTEYRRLTGTNFGLDKRTPIQRMVDGATGFSGVKDAEAKEFFEFVRKCVFMPMLVQWLTNPDGGVV